MNHPEEVKALMSNHRLHITELQNMVAKLYFEYENAAYNDDAADLYDAIQSIKRAIHRAENRRIV